MLFTNKDLQMFNEKDISGENNRNFQVILTYIRGLNPPKNLLEYKRNQEKQKNMWAQKIFNIYKIWYLLTPNFVDIIQII